MIVTVTPNTGIDYTLAVPGLQLNKTIRSSANAWGMGGKASDAAWILGTLQTPVLALGFAAGMTGEKMQLMLRERGVTTDFVWVGGESRLNIILVSTEGSGQSTFTSSSLMVSDEHREELLARYQAALHQATCVILGGTLPDGVPLDLYPQMITQARDRGIPVIFDASGPALQAGLEARPSIIKPNLDELGQLLGFVPPSLTEIYRAARRLQQDYGTDVIVTQSSQDAVAVLGERSYQIPALPLPISSVAGAGDGVLAGMALAFSHLEPLENGLRYGFALAGAVLQTLATADFRVEDYLELLPRITLIPFQGDTP
ncbi:MAG TPA: 1-phosphofructokinase family hexose kinase [Anaerolineales bacterium]